MSYIGNSPAPFFTAVTTDVFSANGTGTDFALSRRISNLADIEVIVDNIQQNPFSGSYSVSGTTLSFSAAPSAGSNNVVVTYRQATIGSSIPTPNTVGNSALQSDLNLTGNTTTQNILPAANVTYDIGSADMRYRDLYLSGNTIQLGAVSLSTNNDTFVVANTTGGVLPSELGNTTVTGTLTTSETIVVGNSSVNTIIHSTGITANGANIHSVNAATVGGNTASDLRSYASNASNISTGTLSNSRLPSTISISTLGVGTSNTTHPLTVYGSGIISRLGDITTSRYVSTGHDGGGYYEEWQADTTALSQMRFQARDSNAGNYTSVAIHGGDKAVRINADGSTRLNVSPLYVDIQNAILRAVHGAGGEWSVLGSVHGGSGDYIHVKTSLEKFSYKMVGFRMSGFFPYGAYGHGFLGCYTYGDNHGNHVAEPFGIVVHNAGTSINVASGMYHSSDGYVVLRLYWPTTYNGVLLEFIANGASYGNLTGIRILSFTKSNSTTGVY